MKNSRRKFIKQVAATSASIPFIHLPFPLKTFRSNSDTLDVSIFSKHLQFLDYKEAGRIAAELGFDGIDLTVRPKGHVLPELVATSLPQAIADIKSSGSTCQMITTSIEDVNNPHDVDIVKTAANYGVEYYRSHWFRYSEDHSMTDSLKIYQEQIRKLGELNKEYGIVGCYQNHAGTHIGASFWEIKMLLETVDPKYFGAQFDIRHATADSGFSWVNGLRLLRDQIKVIVLKDFKWGQVNGQWKAINVPIGEGMVDFTKYFQLLKMYGLNLPVSLHLEYPLGGAEKGRDTIDIDRKIVFDAMKKDLTAVRKLWRDA